MICAGQEPARALADELEKLGIRADLIGGARCASELDAVRAIDEGTRFNNREWSVEAIDNVLHVTSSSARSVRFDRLSIGVKGHTKRIATPLGPEWRIFTEPG